MKIAPAFGSLFVIVLLGVAVQGAPVPPEKGTRDASVYVLGSLYNAAVSHNYSKSQAASDRNESEWNNTEMLNGVNKNPTHEEEALARKDAEVGAAEVPAARKQKASSSGGVLIYSGGDAANLAVAYQGSESQAAENDQKSGYNNQNLGMGVAEDDLEGEEDDMDDRK